MRVRMRALRAWMCIRVCVCMCMLQSRCESGRPKHKCSWCQVVGSHRRLASFPQVRWRMYQPPVFVFFKRLDEGSVKALWRLYKALLRMWFTQAASLLSTRSLENLSATCFFVKNFACACMLWQLLYSHLLYPCYSCLAQSVIYIYTYACTECTYNIYIHMYLTFWSGTVM
jgi:hypothetical protein